MSVTINGTSGLVFNDASTQATAATGFGFKNRIINGAMMIDQRNAGASVNLSSTPAYPVDRFYIRTQSGSGSTAQQSSTAPAGFIKSSLVTIGTGASPTSGQINYLIQSVEGFNIADLGWGSASAKTVTLSFWVRSSLTGTFGGAIGNSAVNRSYPFTYTISSANTWTQASITIVGDTSGTWATDNSTGINVFFDLGSGSTFQGTAGSWAGADYRAATGAVQLIAISGATLYITGIQLEVGSTATSFDYRPYGTELDLCYRFFAKFSAPCLRGIAANSTTESGRRMGMVLPVTMRATPTVTHSGMQLYDGSVACNVTGTAGGFSTAQVIELDLNSDSSGMTLGRACVQYQSAGSLSASAEL